MRKPKGSAELTAWQRFCVPEINRSANGNKKSAVTILETLNTAYEKNRSSFWQGKKFSYGFY
jgi:hypothetical protein